MIDGKIDKSDCVCSCVKGLYHFFLRILEHYVAVCSVSRSDSWLLEKSAVVLHELFLKLTLFSNQLFLFKGDKYFDLLTINEEKNMFRYNKSSSNIEYLEQI